MADPAAAVRAAQAQSNRNAAKHAESFAGHRARLTAALIEALPAGAAARVCLLGAGNCLDVDLEALAARAAEIHLVDLDPAALQRALERQRPEVRAKLHRHAPVDLSGALPQVGRWRRAAPGAAELATALDEALAGVGRALPGPFDLVGSCCLVTQLSLGLGAALAGAPGEAALPQLRRAVAGFHLRTLAALLAPGGQALFASDLVSDATYPLDALAPDADLAALWRELVAAGNFFFGADPTLYAQLLRRDPALAAAFGPATFLPPWLWQNGPARLFLVYAFRLARR